MPNTQDPELKKASDTDSNTNSEYLLLFSGKDPKDVQVKQLWFRGDSRFPRFPDDIFKKGFTARTNNLDILSHLRFSNSAYISTSTSKEVAGRFPPSAREAFIYEINPQKKAVDVGPHIQDAVKNQKMSLEDAELFLAEEEMAVPHKIKSSHIKGAWPVRVDYVFNDALEYSMYVRTVSDEYIPNPHYANTAAAKILSGAKIAGHGLSGAGAVLDGVSLYDAYKASKAMGDFNPFFREGARILGAWSSAFALGKTSAEIGATIGSAAGPVGMAVGAVSGVVIGSVAGYHAGGMLAEESYDVAQIKEAHAIEIEVRDESELDEIYFDRSHLEKIHPLKGKVELEPHKEFDDSEIRQLKSIKEEKLKAGQSSDAATLEAIESKFHISKNIQLLHKKMNLVMAAFSDADIQQFEKEPSIKKLHEELSILREAKHRDDLQTQEKILEKEKQLQHLKAVVTAKRVEFTHTLSQVGHGVSGASYTLGIMGELELMNIVQVMGKSIFTIIENSAALLGHGMLAGSINPLLAFKSIAEATFNIVSLFKSKSAEPNQLALLLPYIHQLAENIEKLTTLTKNEFSAVKHQIYENHLISLERFSALADNQQDTLSVLYSIYDEVRSSSAMQNDKLRHISNKLYSIEYKIDSAPYREDIESLEKILRFVVENTNVDFNKLSNELDAIGLKNSISHQLDDVFSVNDDAKPVDYFQITNYFYLWLKDVDNQNKPEDLQNPLLVIYACIANLLLNLNETPNPKATFASERILVRDILRLKNYKAIFNEWHELIKIAQNPTLLNVQIDKLRQNALYLAEAIDKRTLALEERYTKEKQMFVDQQLMSYRQELSTRFSNKFEINDYGWYKGYKEFKKRWYVGRTWQTNYPPNTPYIDDALNIYLRETEKRIADQRHSAIKIIRDNSLNSKQNHLSASKNSTISPFHGVGYIIPEDGRLPILPAPDPLLPPDHPHFEVLQKLREAQIMGDGFPSFEYAVKYNAVTLLIYFNVFPNIHQISNKKLQIAAIQAFDYSPRFYEPEEAIWYYWMGGRITQHKQGKTKEWHVGRKITHGQACAGKGYGHKSGEFEYTAWSITEPGEFTDIPAKVNQIYRKDTQFSLLHNLDDINKLIEQGYHDLEHHIKKELRLGLDYTAADDLGIATRIFEESYRDLYGLLSFGHFDSMQQGMLAIWFNQYAVNTKRLKENPSRSMLDNLANDLLILKKIINQPNPKPSFELLDQVDGILEDFIDLYEHNAIEYNDKRPRKEKSSEVANALADILVNMVNNVILTMPQAVSEEIIKQALSASQLESLDEESRNEVFQRIQEKFKYKNSHQLPGSSQSIIKEIGASENTAHRDNQPASVTSFFGIPFANAAKLEMPPSDDIAHLEEHDTGKTTSWGSALSSAASWTYSKLADFFSSENDRLSAEEKPEPAATPSMRRSEHSTFIRPLAIDDYLTCLTWALPLYKDSLPWNKLKSLSENQLAWIENKEKELVSIKKEFEEIKKSRSYRFGVNRDDFEDTEKLITIAQKQIDCALQYKKSSSNDLFIIKENISRVQKKLPMLINKKLAHESRQKIRKEECRKKRLVKRSHDGNQYFSVSQQYSLFTRPIEIEANQPAFILTRSTLRNFKK